MRAFAEAYPDSQFVQQAVALLPWGHNVRLIETVKDRTEREWYVRQAIEHGWSRNVLVHQIESGLFDRQGKALTNFHRTLPAPQSELAQEIIKDPYYFDFLALGPEMLERDLERGLLENLRSLILELGKGFAFVGSQYHLEVGGQDYYFDLLFYHLRLRCFVVIDLKIEEFKPEFAGKMNFYLSAIDDQLRHAHDAPTIGIICASSVMKSSLNMPCATLQNRWALPNMCSQALCRHSFGMKLPTLEELAREFPYLSLVKLRIEIEQALRSLMTLHGLPAQRPMGLGNMLRELDRHNVRIPATEGFLKAMSPMNAAAHGIDISVDEAQDAERIGAAFLAQIRNLRGA